MIKWPWTKKATKLSQEDEQLRDDYLSLFKTRISRGTSVDELTFVVLDTETTGLDIKNDTILSLAALKIKGGEISVADRLECFIQDTRYRPGQSVEIHGITRSRANSGDELGSVIRQFISYVGNGIIVGHHIGFDIKILDKYVYALLGIHIKNKSIDTAIINHRLEHSMNETLKPISLDELAEKYSIPLGERHTAAADTYITATLFLKLLNRLKKRGVDTYGSIVK